MYPVLFYRTLVGNPVIKEWLHSLDKPDRAIVGEDLMTIQIGFPMVGMPHCRALGDGLWEVRSSLLSNREARVIFFHEKKAKALVVVHAFIKKSQKTPKADLDLARKRMKEFSP